MALLAAGRSGSLSFATSKVRERDLPESMCYVHHKSRSHFGLGFLGAVNRLHCLEYVDQSWADMRPVSLLRLGGPPER
jgi:hypothetical protein